MKAVMVKHTPKGKVFWFEVPEALEKLVCPGVDVLCDTSIGMNPATAISAPVDTEEAAEVMRASGAVFPLRKIVKVVSNAVMSDINISKEMAHSRPGDKKIANRFMEFYHKGKFATTVEIDARTNTLLDGYTAYVVAKLLHLDTIPATFVMEG